MNLLKRTQKLIRLGKRNRNMAIKNKLMTKEEAQDWDEFYEIWEEIVKRVQ